MTKYEWQPTAPLQNIKLRALILQKIRDFFASRNILEVETPLLSHSSIPDPNILSITANYQPLGSTSNELLFLQTSPEFAMKRLIAAGSGSIYQICKAFRNGETGSQHNPEFTILEWYHMGFDHHDLMAEMDEFLQHLINCKKADRISYREAFQHHLGIDPLQSTVAELQNCAIAHNIEITDNLGRDAWLNLLMSYLIEPKLGKNRPTFIYNFPSSQGALARINPNDPDVAERFELYINGVELANGFHELNNAEEQRQRFTNDLAKRKQQGLPEIPLDENLLQALTQLPDCAGVAVGIDRLLMIIAEAKCIAEVLTFPLPNA